MKVLINPSPLSGNITVPFSKSILHRVLIASALAKKHCFIPVDYYSDDINATLACISVLFCYVNKTKNGVELTPHDIPLKARINCNSSGTTLRFFLPIVCSLGIECYIACSNELIKRPCDDLVLSLCSHGVAIGKYDEGYFCKGKLLSGDYIIDGSISSQYLSGLLFSLPLSEGCSVIKVTGDTVSNGYIKLTLDTLRKFGVNIVNKENLFLIKPCDYSVNENELNIEGDWTHGAFWKCVSFYYPAVTVSGLSYNSNQQDSIAESIIKTIVSSDGCIDCTDIPDIVPYLSVLSSFADNKTVFTNVARLKYKESDRLSEIRNLLSAMGKMTEYRENGLVVYGNSSRDVDKITYRSNDHRMIMAALLCSVMGRASVVIEGAEFVSKSYPEFFDDYKKIGGIVKIMKGD